MDSSPPAGPLFHEDVGRGSVLVFLHAFPLDRRMWLPQRNAFSGGYRVILPDFRGFGASSEMPPAASIDEHADDIAALLDHLGVTKATFVGLSMGGYVALAFAERHREKLAALVLADTKAGADTPEAKKKRDETIALVQRDGPNALAEQMLPKLLSPIAPPVSLAHVRAIAAEQKSPGLEAALLAMRDRPDRSRLLPELKVPSLVLVGEDDVVTPPDEARRLADALASSTFVELRGASHLSNVEVPEAFNDALLGWLRTHVAD
jgi:3-oxoadipate enol-lactonase